MGRQVIDDLTTYLQADKNINARLLHAILTNSTCYIPTEEIDSIYPFLLPEITHELYAQHAVSLLKSELKTSTITNWQLTYLKYKLDLFTKEELRLLLIQHETYFKDDQWIHREMSLDSAYLLLILIENLDLLTDGEIFSQTMRLWLPGLMIYNAKNYDLITFSVLVEAFVVINDNSFAGFVAETTRFIENLQTKKGDFGFVDPFFRGTDKGENNFIITIHLALAYRKLQLVGRTRVLE